MAAEPPETSNGSADAQTEAEQADANADADGTPALTSDEAGASDSNEEKDEPSIEETAA